MNAARIKAIHDILKDRTQIRVVVPHADWKLYQTARRYNLDYRQTLLNHGRRWARKLPVDRRPK
jgi:hypothetical protein